MTATINIHGVQHATGEARLLGDPRGWLVGLEPRNDSGTYFTLSFFGDGRETAQAMLGALEKAAEELRSLATTLPQTAQAVAS